MGLPLMPWQRYVVDVALEVDPVTGWWAFDKVVLTVQRRAGKSALGAAVKVDRMATTPRGKLWMSAQGGEEAILAWRDLAALLERSALTHKARTYTTTGKERTVWLPTGAELRPIPPNGDKLHGKAIDLLDLDELWFYDAPTATKMKAGYRPTFLTTNAQAWLVSTMGTNASAWLNEERNEGRRAVELGANRGTAYFEFSVPEEIGGVPVEDLDVDALIEALLAYHPANGTHPHMPPTKLAQFIRDDLADPMIGLAGVLRNYGNVAREDDTDRLFPAPVVAVATTTDRIPTSVVPALAFDVDPDRRCATLAAGWRSERGGALVEVIEHGLGTRWVAASVIGVMERHGIERVTCNNAGPARDVADEIERAGYEVVRVPAIDYAAACARFHDELKAPRPTVRHYGQADLVTAFPYVSWRRLGQAVAFAGRSEPITPVTACTLALWAADHPVVGPAPGKPRVVTV